MKKVIDIIKNFWTKIEPKVTPVTRFIGGKLRTFLSWLWETFKAGSKKKKAVMLLLALAIGAGAFLGVKALFFKVKKVVAEAVLISVKVQAAAKKNFSDTYLVMGTVRGAVENELRFEVEGTLSNYNFKEGDRIAKGAIICSLDPKDALSKASFARSRYNSEKSVYFSAAQRLKVYEDLFRMKAISETKLQESRYQADSAHEKMKASLSELELAQLNLEKTNLFAPSYGILAEKIIQAGEYVTPHDVVTKFITIGDANFEVDVPEKDVGKLRIGMKVKVLCDAYGQKEFKGLVKEIAPTVKEKTRTTIIKIGIPNPEGLLRSGMFARGEVILMEMDESIAVPQDSIIALGNETKLVPLVKANPNAPNMGTVELRQVVIGQTMGKSVIIKDGIFPGELIVMETSGQLSDGLPIQYTELTDQQQPKE